MPDRKKALVTGASEGIGRAFSVRLAAEGFDVLAVARDETRLAELHRELGPGNHSCHATDLSMPREVEKVAEELATNHYDVLINNAGYAIYSPFYQTDLARFQSMTRVNCDALVVLSHSFLNAAQAGDTLINVASGLAFLPMPKAGVYAATKSFVLAFSETLWYEQKGRGVNVIALCPGATATRFHWRAGGSERDLPPKTITQTPEQVVDVAIKAIRKRKGPTVISGSFTTMMTVMARLMPRKHLVTMIGRNS